MVNIKEMPVLERPRERLISKGVNSLSDSELLAIILKTGTNTLSAKDLAINIINKYESIKNLKNITYQELIKIKGIGVAKACQVIASVELARRISNIYDNIENIKLTNAKEVYEYYKNNIDAYQECFYCLYLDCSKRVLKEKKLFMGTTNRSMVHPRDVFKEAYIQNATAFICVHNHPNGDVTPSKDDILTTDRLNQIGVLLGIKLVDHVIVAENGYYSFLENGKI